MVDITPEHQALADRLVATAAIDGEGIELYDALYEVVAGGTTTAVAVLVLQTRQLAEAAFQQAAADATDEEDDE